MTRQSFFLVVDKTVKTLKSVLKLIDLYYYVNKCVIINIVTKSINIVT